MKRLPKCNQGTLSYIISPHAFRRRHSAANAMNSRRLIRTSPQLEQAGAEYHVSMVVALSAGTNRGSQTRRVTHNRGNAPEHTQPTGRGRTDRPEPRHLCETVERASRFLCGHSDLTCTFLLPHFEKRIGGREEWNYWKFVRHPQFIEGENSPMGAIKPLAIDPY